MDLVPDPYQFRPTLWPGGLVDPFPLWPVQDVVVDGDWIRWPEQSGWPDEDEPVHLPVDFCIREFLEADPDDLHVVAEWMRQYGRLMSLQRDDLPFMTAFDIARVPADPPLIRGSEPAASLPLPRMTVLHGGGGFHRDVVKAWLSNAQQSVRIWLVSRHPCGLEALAFAKTEDVGLIDHQVPIDIDDLVLTMNAALRPMSVRISADFESDMPVLGTINTNVFVQIYNYMSEEVSLKRCANQNCGRAFIRQRGRAKYGQHRANGVVYCSRECARAQAQRELRRRRTP